MKLLPFAQLGLLSIPAEVSEFAQFRCDLNNLSNAEKAHLFCSNALASTFLSPSRYFNVRNAILN